jgi:transposase
MVNRKLAKSLGINATMLGRWIKELDTDDGLAFRGNGKLTPDQEEIKKLKVQVKRLEMEKDILKIPQGHVEATVFFAAETK